MPHTFLSLPAELRNEVYKYLLVTAAPIEPFSHWHSTNGLAPNILCTNSTILHEARPFLYGKNHFNLATGGYGRVDAINFIDTIGFLNASYILSIRINFPDFECIDYDMEYDDDDPEFGIGPDSLGLLDRIVSHCTSLRSITATTEHLKCIDKTCGNAERQAFIDGLPQVDFYLKEITSLQEIHIEVHEDAPASDWQGAMKSYGWILDMVEGMGDKGMQPWRAFLPSLFAGGARVARRRK